MNQHDFEAELQKQGYEVFYGGMNAGEVVPDHQHEVEHRVLVIAGEITVKRGGKADIVRAGDVCEVAAGEMHAEYVGAKGMAYVAGRRAPGAVVTREL